MKEDTLKFLDIFYEAIGNATDEYNVFPRKFKEQANKELSHHLDGADNPIDYDNETTDADKILRKTDQIRLAIQIEDIVDELEMLKQLFTIQLSILKRGWTGLDGLGNFEVLRNSIQDVLHKLSTQYILQLDGMLSSSERLRKKLFDLQDLQQKEEDIHEAQTANRCCRRRTASVVRSETSALRSRPSRCRSNPILDPIHVHRRHYRLLTAFIHDQLLWHV